ncbi:MAG: hypothetical protein D4R64_17025 [Porphyromonadaceae bacterium]|nr:MAG: hypothetical protein D4R64_17025 [Porphyromonadaceae bacterium]
MDSIETILSVREDLAEIEKIFVWMEKSKEIHQIDIDVLLNKTRHLYNQLISLPVGQFEIQTVAEAEAVLPAPEPKPEPQPQPPQPPQPQQIMEPVREPEPLEIPVPVRETVSEMNLFQRDGSLNDALGKQKPVHDVASSITDIPIADIWSAVTINERFLFIRELFGNDPEGFKNTVTLLNSLGSWEAAKKFMTDRFEWDKNNPVAVDFLNVVRRRFLK